MGGTTIITSTLSVGDKIVFPTTVGQKIVLFDGDGLNDHAYGIGISSYSTFYSCQASHSSHVFTNSGDMDGSGDGNKLLVIGSNATNGSTGDSVFVYNDLSVGKVQFQVF